MNLPQTDRELMLQHIQSDIDFQKNIYARLDLIDNRLNPEKDEYILKTYIPLLEAWEGISFVKKVFLGFGAFSTAFAAIGAIVWWSVTHIK